MFTYMPLLLYVFLNKKEYQDVFVCLRQEHDCLKEAYAVHLALLPIAEEKPSCEINLKSHAASSSSHLTLNRYLSPCFDVREFCPLRLACFTERLLGGS